MTTFKVGDTVTWSSQANGSAKRKTGIVVCVVPANTPAHKWAINHDDYLASSPAFDGGMPRNHESYLVGIPRRGGRFKLYWPRVRDLKKED